MMAESRLDLVLSANNQQFNQALAASTGEVEAIKDSIAGMSEVGEEMEGMTAKAYAIRDSIEMAAEYTSIFGAKVVKAFSDSVAASTKAQAGQAEMTAGAKTLSIAAEVVSKGFHLVEHAAMAAFYYIDAKDIFGRMYDAAKESYEGIMEWTEKSRESFEEYVASYENNPYVQAAAKAEEYKIQLKTLMGTEKQAVAELKHMYEVAANSKFSTDSIIEAGTQLEEFGQSIQRFLPTVLGLAQATGQTATRAAQIFGHALQAPGEGLALLDKRLHITTDDLIHYGAAHDATNKILTETISQEKAYINALEQAGKARGSDVNQKDQVLGVSGAFTKLHNVMEMIMETIGGSFSKALVNNIEGVTKLAKEVLGLTEDFKPLIGAFIKLGGDGLKISTKLMLGFTEGMHKLTAGTKENIQMANKGATAFERLAGSLALIKPAMMVIGAMGMGAIGLKVAAQYAIEYGMKIRTAAVAAEIAAKGFAEVGGAASKAGGAFISAGTGIMSMTSKSIPQLAALSLVITGTAAAFQLIPGATGTAIAAVGGMVTALWAGKIAMEATLFPFNLSNAIFGGVAGGIGKVTGKLAEMIPQTNKAGQAIAGLLNQASAASTGLVNGTQYVAKFVSFLNYLPGILMIAGAAYYAFSKVTEENAILTKEYTEAQQKALEIGRKHYDLVGKTPKQFREMGASIYDAKDAIASYSEEIEINSGKIKAQQERLFNLSNQFQDMSWDELQSEKAKANAIITSSKLRNADLQSQKDDLIKRAAAVQEANDKEGLSGKKLYEHIQGLEDENFQYEKDLAAGKIEFEKEKAAHSEKIFKETALRKFHWEAEVRRAIAALDKEKAAPSGTTEEEKKAQADKIALRQKELEDAKRGRQDNANMNHQAAIEQISHQHAMIQESMDMESAALDTEMALGKKSKTDRLNLLKDYIAKSKEDTTSHRKWEIQLEQESARLSQEIANDKIKAQIRSDEAKVESAQRELDILHEMDLRVKDRPKELAEQLKKENDIINKNYDIRIENAKKNKKMEVDLEGDENEKNAKRAEWEEKINALERERAVVLRDNNNKFKEYADSEIANNIALASSYRSLLEAELSVLEVKRGKGADNESEIKANKKKNYDKIVEAIKAQEIIDLNAATRDRKSESDKKVIKDKARDDLKIAEMNFNKEMLQDSEQSQQRASDRAIKIKDAEIQKIENDQLAMEERIRAGKESSVGVFEKELNTQRQLTDEKIKQITADEKLQSIGKTGKDLTIIQKKAEQDRTRARLEGDKQIKDSSLKEFAANADMRERELEDQMEALQFKKELGEVDLNSAKKERDLVVETLGAKLKSIKAHEEEQKASSDIKDFSRIERDARIQSQKAIRESVKALKDLNDAQKPVTSEADKLQKKYDKILDDIQKAHDILAEADKKPEEDAPTPEELRNNPGARIDYEARLKIKEMREAPNAKIDAQKERARETRADLIKANNDAKFKAASDLAKEMKAKGATPQEIKDAIYKQNQEMDNAIGAGAQKSAGANISNPKANETQSSIPTPTTANTPNTAISAPTETSKPGSTVPISGTKTDSKTTSTSTSSTGSGDLSETNSILREMLGVLKNNKSTTTDSTVQKTEPVRPKLRNSNEAYQQAQLPPKTDWRGKSLAEMSDSDRFALAPAPHPGYQT